MVYEVTWFANSNGITTGGVQTPGFVADLQSDLKLFAPVLPGFVMSTGRIDPVHVDLGYNLEFTMLDTGGLPSLFPSDAVFYISDIDAGEVLVSARLGGLPMPNW